MRSRSIGRWVLSTIIILMYLYLLAPILIIIPVSFSSNTYIVFPPTGFSLQWYINFFSLYEMTSALRLSLYLAVITMVVSTISGTMASLALVRYRFWGREFLRSFFLAPMVIPRVVLGIALLVFLSRTYLSGSFWGLLAAHVTITLPYVIRTVSATLVGFDLTLEQAALSLGARPLNAFLTITLPIIRPGLIAGAIFAFVISFDELVVSLFLTGPALTTLPVQIYNYIEFTSDPTIAAISVILVAFTAVVVLITERIVGFSFFV
jgi:putative spermidine/putrescine transport system permease protein